MKKMIMALLLVGASVAQAGSGGYSTETCVSSSGRTVVTFNISDFESQLTVSIDGISENYVSGKNNVSIDIEGDGTLSVRTDDKAILDLMKMKAAGQSNLWVSKGMDPRLKSDISHVASSDEMTYTLTCKSYSRAP